MEGSDLKEFLRGVGASDIIAFEDKEGHLHEIVGGRRVRADGCPYIVLCEAYTGFELNFVKPSPEVVKVFNEFNEELWNRKQGCKCFSKNIEASAKRIQDSMMDPYTKSFEEQCQECSYIANELNKRGIKVTMSIDLQDIYLFDENTRVAIPLSNLWEIKAFAFGLDWGVRNANRMAREGLHSPIIKEG